MNENFLIEIEVGNLMYSFNCHLQAIGYTHKIITTLNGVEVVFEPDEERKYRAIMPNGSIDKLKKSDIEAIRSLVTKLETL